MPTEICARENEVSFINMFEEQQIDCISIVSIRLVCVYISLLIMTVASFY